MARSNVSPSLRELQNWQLVQVVPIGKDLQLTTRIAALHYAAWSPNYNMHFGYWRMGARLLKLGERLVVADGFLDGGSPSNAVQYRIYRKLCECWVITELIQIRPFLARLETLGFRDIAPERLQWRVAPSVAHIPWVTLQFLLTDVVFGTSKMTRARWNNVLAPVLLPFVSAPLGPMTYCMITATKA